MILARCRTETRKASQQRDTSSWQELKGNDEQQPQALDEWRPAQDTQEKNAHVARQAERSDRYHQLVQLREPGLTLKEIARRLGMGETNGTLLVDPRHPL